MITMGFEKCKITPSLPCRLAGYQQYRMANEVHDDLYARCIVFDDTIRYAIIQLDWIGVDHILLEALTPLLKPLHIEASHIMLCATHTHAGPMGVSDTFGMDDMFGEVNYAYVKECAKKIATAIQKACEDLKPVSIAFSHSQVENVGKERHEATRIGDDSLFYIEFTRSDARKVMIYNYACHPTVSGPSNIAITKDLPYGVERDWDADMVVFINSCAGDISTRFTRESSSFEQIEIYTKQLIKALLEAKQNKIDLGPLTNIKMQTFEKEYACKKVQTIEEANAHLQACLKQVEEAKQKQLSPSEMRVISSYAEGALTAVHLAKALANIKKMPMMITMLQLQNIVIAGVPGELFSTLGKPLKQEGIEVFGYTNGYHLYIADEASYEEGVYEALSSPFEKGVGEKLIEEIKKRGKELCQ